MGRRNAALPDLVTQTIERNPLLKKQRTAKHFRQIHRRIVQVATHTSQLSNPTPPIRNLQTTSLQNNDMMTEIYHHHEAIPDSITQKKFSKLKYSRHKDKKYETTKAKRRPYPTKEDRQGTTVNSSAKYAGKMPTLVWSVISMNTQVFDLCESVQICRIFADLCRYVQV